MSTLSTPQTVYAQDPLDAAALINALIPHIGAEPELHWAALVDTAFDEGATPLPGAADSINCFADTGALEDLAAIAPCLVPLPANGGGEATLQSLLRHAGSRPMLSVLASRIDLVSLVRHWAPLHLVRLTDGSRYLLRWADTRTLAVLPDVLAPAQWNAIAAPLAHWFSLNREGQPVTRDMPAEGTHVAGLAPEPLVLGAAQVQRLAEEAEADALHGQVLAALEAAGASPMPHSTVHRHTHAAFALARTYRVDDMTDRMALAVVASLSDGKSLQHELLPAVMQVREWERGHLFETLVQMRIAPQGIAAAQGLSFPSSPGASA